MYTDFAAKLCHNLIEDGFYVASQQKDITEYTPLVILMKNQSPVLYVVNIINADFYLAGYFESQSRQMFGDIEKNMNTMYCASCVSVNILVSKKLAPENRGYCDEKPMVTGEKISSVWWTADLNNNELYAGKEQPDKIAGIERAVKAAFSAEEYKGSANVEEIEKTARPKSFLPVVSRDISFTYALMFFNVFIFLFVHFSGNEGRFLQQFACSGQHIWHGGEFYRLFTAMFFHSGWEHIIFNVFSIYIFASRCELYMGRANTIAVYFLSGIAASVVSSLLNTSMAVGASGAICGLIGAILVLSKVKNKEVGGLSYFTILLYALLVIGFGILSPGVDNYAHAGGFVAGILLQLIIEAFKGKKINNAQ